MTNDIWQKALTESIEKAVKKTLGEIAKSEAMAKQIAACVASDISWESYEERHKPEYPPKGAIITGAAKGGVGALWMATDDGVGYTEDCETIHTWNQMDHYRVIPKAEDALKALDGAGDNFSYWHEDNKPIVNDAVRQGYLMGIDGARNAIRNLIDNAQEG